MKSPMARVIGLAVLISTLLVSVVLAQGRITSAYMTDAPNGAEMALFPSGISVVYLVLQYTDMQNNEITVRVYDNVGNVIFEKIRTYTGVGTESIEIYMAGRGAFPDGRYVTNLYSGRFPIKTIIWEVTPDAGMTTPTPPSPTATATAMSPTPTSTPVPPTPTPVPPTATPFPTPTLEPGQPTPTPVPPTPTHTPEQPYPPQPTPTPSTPTPTPGQPTPTPPVQPTLTPTPMLPTVTVTEAAPTPTLTPATEVTPTPTVATVLPSATPVPATVEMVPSPTPTTLLPTPSATLTPRLTSVPTVTVGTAEEPKSFWVIAGYGAVAVMLVSLALFLWGKRSP